MSTNVHAGPTTSKVAAEPPKNSPIRLVVLLGLLGLVIGAYVYDFLIAKPGVEAAEKKIDAFVEGRNRMGVKESALVTAADIQKELGMKPAFVEKHPEDNYEIEYYCWWGAVPVLNMRRHYIAIVYVGGEPRHFSSQHRNEKPPREALPIPEEPAPSDADEKLPMPESTTGEKGKDNEQPAATNTETPTKESDAPAKEATPLGRGAASACVNLHP